MFEGFGVSTEAESLYRVLVERPGVARGTLPALWGRDENAIHAALSELLDLGLAVWNADSEPVAVPPDRAVANLIAREEAAIENRRRELDATRASIPDLVDAFVDSRRHYAGDNVELLTDAAVVRSRLYQLAAEAKTSVWALQPDLGLSREAMAAARPLDHDLRRREVECRLVVTSASLPSPGWLDYLWELEGIGQSIRVATALTQRCIVVDQVCAVIPNSDQGSPGAYVLHGASLVAPVIALVEEVWLHATPLPVRNDATDGPVSHNRMRDVATLLAAGIKDETLARRLGVSVRTVRRLIAATMSELQAESRFQAGVNAARLGWLGPDRVGEP